MARAVRGHPVSDPAHQIGRADFLHPALTRIARMKSDFLVDSAESFMNCSVLSSNWTRAHGEPRG